jgi:hypothetical protein
MNKLLAAILTSAAVLALGTSVLAAEQAKDTQSRDNQTQAQPNATKGKPGQSDSPANTNTNRMKDGNAGAKQQDREAVGANDPAKNQASDQANRNGTSGSSQNTQGSESDPAYAAELKKCDSMQGDSKSKCITAAKKKAGQM